MSWANLILSIASLFLISCDPIPMVRSDIPWGASWPDVQCIKKAVDRTPGIKFESEEGPDVMQDCRGCEKRIFSVHYSVVGNSQYKMAQVKLFEAPMGQGRRLKNYAMGRMGDFSFPETDEKGFKKAIRALNESIQKTCPGAGIASEPR